MKNFRNFLIAVALVCSFVPPINASSEKNNSQEITAGILRNWPPYYLTDSRTGRPAGFAIDIMNKISEMSGLDVRYVVYNDWPDVVEAFKKGQIVLLPNMGISQNRQKLYAFTTPYETFRISVFTRKTTVDISDLKQLPEIKVGAVETNQGLTLIKNLNVSDIEVFKSPEELFMGLLSGTVDAAVYPEQVIQALASNSGLEGEIKFVAQPLQEIKRGVAIRKGDPALFHKIDSSIQQLIKTPEFKAIYAKWHGRSESDWTVRNVIFVMGAILILTFIVMFFWRYVSIVKLNRLLSESEEKYRNLFESMSEGFALHEIICDESGKPCDFRFLELNPSCERLTGVRHAEVAGRCVNEIAIDVPWIERHGEVALTGKTQHFETFSTTLNKWFEVFTFQSGTGQCASVFRDITERKKMEETLKQNEKKFRRVFEAANVGKSITLPTGELFVNKAFADMLGYDKDALLHRTWQELTPQDEIETAEALLVPLLNGEKDSVRFNKRYVHRDGSFVWADISMAMQRDINGTPEYFIATIVNITERRLAEQKIVHLNNILRAIRDVNQLIVHEKDCRKLIQEGCRLLVENRGYRTALIIITDQNQQPVLWSGAGFGEAFEEFSSKLERGELPSCCDGLSDEVHVIHNRETLCENCSIGELYETLDIMHVGLAHDNKRLGCMIVSLERGLADDPEERKLYSEVANDLSFAISYIQDEANRKASECQRKALEKQVLHLQKMESIGNLAGGIAHDFNNILSSIIGFTELALDDVEKHSLIADNLQEVYTAGKRAKDLVAQILAFAQQSEEKLKPVQVSLIVKEVLKFIRPSIPSTIEIKKNIESESYIMGSPTQVHQIMMNLCTNAAHAMEDEGGILSVNVKDVMIDRNFSDKIFDLTYGNYIELSVSDTGTGIAPDIIESILEPYFTTKEPGEGTGMGLAMVSGIVESYRGKIIVNSTLGQGSTFTIYLPITQKYRAFPQYEAEALPTGTERILLVDDEVQIVKMGSQVLKALGYEVSTSTSSMEAIALFRSKPALFDLVITDMTMPHMTGDQLAIELIKIRPDIPIILCTGYSKKISEITAPKIGIRAFAYKPILRAEFVKIIRKVLDEARTET